MNRGLKRKERRSMRKLIPNLCPCANSKDWKSLKEEALSPTGRGRDAGWKVLWRRKTTAASTVRQALASAVTLLAPEKIIKF